MLRVRVSCGDGIRHAGRRVYHGISSLGALKTSCLSQACGAADLGCRHIHSANNGYPVTNGSDTFTLAQIREKFLQYFEANNHVRVPSSKLIPHNDPSLLFTNAGMVQFKNWFLGSEEAKHKQVSTAQKCVRAGGKHNDLENVGHTARHHTFFEMLGNFSFGAYFKEGAIDLAWNFLTKELQLPKEKLYITVYEGDTEAEDIWKKKHGIPNSRLRYGDNEENFWSMGHGPGPCGPCSEIYYHNPDALTEDDKMLEIWNLVFMQYEKVDGVDGLQPLKVPCVDTGMGLERLASVMQRKRSNFETDVFQNLIGQIHNRVNQQGKSKFQYSERLEHKESSALRVIADHLRAASFLIADGVFPSNIGRGYILRRIIRRAVRYATTLGVEAPILHELSQHVIDEMGAAYPELVTAKASIKTILQNEETAFLSVLASGMKVLEAEFDHASLMKQPQLNSEAVFRLYETLGFPVDLTTLIAKERGFTVNSSEVEKLLESHKELSRESWKGSGEVKISQSLQAWKNNGVYPTFSGYEKTKEDTHITGIATTVEGNKEKIWIALEKCPFYASAGGQIGDTGKVTLNNGVSLIIGDTIAPYEKGIALRVDSIVDPSGTVHNPTANWAAYLSELPSQEVNAKINTKRRELIRRNHTCTHLLQSALRTVLGSNNVTQAGSQVTAEGFRFDFTYPLALDNKQIAAIEEMINEVIFQDIPVSTAILSYDEAIARNAIALFSEKYGDMVRVVTVGDVSTELCGGTHVERTGQIGLFKIIKEGSVASGIRRIQAVTSISAFSYLNNHFNALKSAANELQINDPLTVDKYVDKMIKQNKQLKNDNESLSIKVMEFEHKLSPPFVGVYNNIETLLYSTNDATLQNLMERGQYLKQRNPDSLIVIVSGKLVVALLNNERLPRVNGLELLQALVKQIGGVVGGKPAIARGTLGDKDQPADQVHQAAITHLKAILGHQ